MNKKAVVLLSGGLDSAVTLYHAINKGYDCLALIFDYGQRHRREIVTARRIAEKAGASHRVVKLSLPWNGSSLLSRDEKIPVGRTAKEILEKDVPSTYVPARNTIFLSMAVSCAEAEGAERIFIGAHSDDSSGYPDCRQDYLEAFQKVTELGTKAGIEKRLKVEYPLIGRSKRDIIKMGERLKVPFDMTWSCYKGDPEPCGECDSCVLRAKGFKEAGIADPAIR